MSGVDAEWQGELDDRVVTAEDFQSEGKLVELIAAARSGEYGFMGATLLRKNKWFKDAADSR